MPLNIEGLACLGGFGSGPEALLAALLAALDAPSAVSRTEPLKADTAALAEYFPARSLRQCNHFTRMALLGACLALKDAGLNLETQTGCGLILASGYGPSEPTFDFLNSLLQFGETMASPLAFSHSVHNIPTAVVAKTLHLAGPCCTICQGESSVASGLLAARTWLAEGRVDRVLFGAVDEITPPLQAATDHMLQTNAAPLASGLASFRDLPLGEGAVFLCLSRHLLGQAERARLGRITAIEVHAATPDSAAPPSWKPSEAEWKLLSGAVPPDLRQATGGMDCSPAYGITPIAHAFDLVAALALMQRSPLEHEAEALCLNRAIYGDHALIRLARGEPACP